jgi:hypothetical protein
MSTSAQVHKSKKNLAGIDGLKSTLQSAGLKVLPKLHKLALLRQMALIIPTPASCNCTIFHH